MYTPLWGPLFFSRTFIVKLVLLANLVGRKSDPLLIYIVPHQLPMRDTFFHVTSWHSLKVYISMTYDAYLQPRSHHHIKIQNISSSRLSQKVPHSGRVGCSFNNHCRWVCVLQKWNQTLHTFWCLASLTWNNHSENDFKRGLPMTHPISWG